jgi:hypothetical protein
MRRDPVKPIEHQPDIMVCHDAPSTGANGSVGRCQTPSSPYQPACYEVEASAVETGQPGAPDQRLSERRSFLFL